jgi:hypothetical protein
MYHLHPFKKCGRAVRSGLFISVSLTLVFVHITSSQSLTQDDLSYAEVRQVLEADQLQVAQPGGLAYVKAREAFIVAEAASSSAAQDVLTFYDPSTNVSQLLDGGPEIAQPINMTYDTSHERLLVLNASTHELTSANLDADQARVSVVTSYNLASFNLQQPSGMSVDPETGTLYILDSATAQVIRVKADGTGGFESSAVEENGSEINLDALATSALRGLAYNPVNGHLYALCNGACGQSPARDDG